MSRNFKNGNTVSLERWINNPGVRKGILSFYANEPFDYDDNRAGYEIGRQIALLAKQYGLTTRGSVIRRHPETKILTVVKTKMPILQKIVYKELGFHPKQMGVELF